MGKHISAMDLLSKLYMVSDCLKLQISLAASPTHSILTPVRTNPSANNISPYPGRVVSRILLLNVNGYGNNNNNNNNNNDDDDDDDNYNDDHVDHDDHDYDDNNDNNNKNNNDDDDDDNNN